MIRLNYSKAPSFELQRFETVGNLYDPWKPEFWATATEKIGLGKYNFQNLVSRKFETDLAQKGKKITVPIQEDITDPVDYTVGSNISFDADSSNETTVELNRSKVLKKMEVKTATELVYLMLTSEAFLEISDS